MLYIHILFYSWKLTMLINAKEEAQSGSVLSFLLQAVQASSPHLPDRGMSGRSTQTCTVYFRQHNPIFL